MSTWDQRKKRQKIHAQQKYRSTMVSGSTLEAWIHISILCDNLLTLTYIPQDPKCQDTGNPNPWCTHSKHFQESLCVPGTERTGIRCLCSATQMLWAL